MAESVRPVAFDRPVLVLLADGDADSREMYGAALSGPDVEVLSAADGIEALNACERRPDVIVTGLTLPGLSGCELARRVDADPRTSGTPVIALTAWADTGHQQCAYSAGCVAVLVKPCPPAVLMGAIRDAFSIRLNRIAWQTRTAGCEAAGEEGAGFSSAVR
jgi:CheY-like chemotaxis protein